ncbi:MAG: ferrous iron transport protein B [Candidatus Sericytochromatia bacterium]
MKTMLLVGFPNSGKSTIFNLLSGKARKVSNYSGVSVDTGVAELKSNIKYSEDEKIQIVDLPGIYNLLPTSIDEAITVGTILNMNNQVKEFHNIVVVIDSAKIEASFSLALALKDIVGKVSVIVNKSDLFYKNKPILWEKLEKLSGLKVLACSAFSEEKETEELLDTFIRNSLKENTIEKIKPINNILLTDKSLNYIPFDKKNVSNINIIDNEEIILEKIKQLQLKSRDILSSVIDEQKITMAQTTYRIDKILLHPFWGIIIFFAIFFFLFNALYTVSAPIMDLLDKGVGFIGEYIGSFLPDGFIRSLVVDGVFAGVGGVIVFLPQIMILFFLLSIMEQSGYIARAAFLTDRLMALFGLNGKAFLPFLSSFACAVPAIMSTRTIADKGERLTTLMVLPLITCSARLPVYILLIGTFIPSFKFWGIFDSQALALFFMYFFGTFFALVMAKIFRLSFFKSKSKSFFMEMPVYQKPKLKVASKQMFRQAKVFLKKAGTTIFYLSLIIWFLSVFPNPDEKLLENKTPEQVASIKLENSAIGRFGKTIEPIIKPLGYDWKMGVGITMAFGARELFVSAMGTIYALGDVDEESDSLKERLQKEVDPITNKPVFNLAVAWSLLIFFAFACQCLSTLSIVKKETNSLKYPVFMFAYMGLMAYAGAFITYNLVYYFFV